MCKPGGSEPLSQITSFSAPTLSNPSQELATEMEILLENIVKGQKRVRSMRAISMVTYRLRG